MRARVTTALEIVGFCAVTAGAGAIDWTYGLIAAGLSLIVIGVFAA